MHNCMHAFAGNHVRVIDRLPPVCLFSIYRCGQNAHGGNIQNGCGHAFNWNEAGPYSADIGTKSSITPFKETPPPEISRVRHFIMDGTAVKCDHCQANIQVS